MLRQITAAAAAMADDQRFVEVAIATVAPLVFIGARGAGHDHDGGECRAAGESQRERGLDDGDSFHGDFLPIDGVVNIGRARDNRMKAALRFRDSAEPPIKYCMPERRDCR